MGTQHTQLLVTIQYYHTMSAYSPEVLNAFRKKVIAGDVSVKVVVPGATTQLVGTLRIATDWWNGSYITHIDNGFEIVSDGRTHSVWSFVRGYLKNSCDTQTKWAHYPRSLQQHLDLIHLDEGDATLHQILSTWTVDQVETDVVNGCSASNSSASAPASNSSVSNSSASNSSASNSSASASTCTEEETVDAFASTVSESEADVREGDLKFALRRARTTLHERRSELRMLKQLDHSIRHIKALDTNIAKLRLSLKEHL